MKNFGKEGTNAPPPLKWKIVSHNHVLVCHEQGLMVANNWQLIECSLTFGQCAIRCIC